MFDIITIGSATRDVFFVDTPFTTKKSTGSSTGALACLPLGSKIEIKNTLFETGGGATNTAITFANLGLKTGIFTRIGNDPSGQEIINTLQQAGADTKIVHIDKKRSTAYSVILLSPKGERTVLVNRGASQFFKVSEISWSKLKTKWIYISSLGGNFSFLKKIISHCQKNNIKIAINPGSLELKMGLKKLKPILNKADILIVNREEAAKLTKQSFKDVKKIITQMQKNFSIITSITDGKRGAYLLEQKEAFFAKTFDVPIVNTTGAGDAFGSAFTAGMIIKDNPEFALRLAIVNSNNVIQKMGAKKGLLEKIPSKRKMAQVKINKL